MARQDSAAHRKRLGADFFRFKTVQLPRNLHLDTDSGSVRNTTAFLGEKLTRAKLLLGDPAGGQLALLEKPEALAL
jgi:hypothetical protein